MKTKTLLEFHTLCLKVPLLSVMETAVSVKKLNHEDKAKRLNKKKLKCKHKIFSMIEKYPELKGKEGGISL